MSIYGEIITGKEVRQALEDTIKMWIPEYLAEVGAKYGFDRGDLPVFATYEPMIQWDKFDEDQIPLCLIIAPGTLDQPQVRDGKLRVRWGAGIGCVVSGQDRDNTWLLAEIYTAAVRTLLLQHPSLGGFSEGIVYISERFDTLPADTARTLGAGSLQVGVDVAAMVDMRAGPSSPAPDPTVPPGDWPIAATIPVEVGHKE